MKSLVVLLGAFAVVFFAAIGVWVTPVFGQFFWIILFFSSLFLASATIFAFWSGLLRFVSSPQESHFLGRSSEILGEAIAVTDLQGHILCSNAVYREVIKKAGYRREVSPQTLYAAYPEAAHRLYQLAQGILEKKRGCQEFRLGQASPSTALPVQGTPTWVRIEAIPESAMGQDRVVWRIKDITEERFSQEEAFERLQSIIATLDHAPTGFFSSDETGKMVYMNATLATLLGYDLQRLHEGQPLTVEDLFGKQGAHLFLKPRTGPGAFLESFHLDAVLPQQNRTLPVLVLHSVDCDETGWVGPSRSLVIEERLLGEKGALQQGLDAEKLISRAPIGIAQVKQNGEIMTANTAFWEISGASPEGGGLGACVEEASQGDVRDHLARAFLGQGSLATAKMSPLNVVFRGPLIRTGQIFFDRVDLPSQTTVAVYVTDTTQHSSLEVQLSQSRKMLAIGQLAGGIAHDFNNVLTAIIGFSDLLIARHKPTDPSFADIMNIKQNANRAANLVRQLLAFSRRQTLRPEVTSLTDIVSDLAHLLGRLLGEKITLKVTHARDVGFVKVDINQFEQVVINLCVNARDAMPEGGGLTIRTYNLDEASSKTIRPGLMPPGEYVVCEVSDTGTGMEPDVLEKIFEPFFTTKEVGKGTGLGLSTVYGIVKQTGGFIFCESQRGTGTTFLIYLPRYHEREVPVSPITEEKKIQKSQDLTGQGTVLLVEDEDAVRAFASRALQSRGYTVLTAETGERALRIFEQKGSEINLVLSDVVMPEMDGPTLLKELRKRGIDTKVVFISGYAEDAFEKNLEGQTDFTFLPKPFTLKQLAETVKDAMGG